MTPINARKIRYLFLMMLSSVFFNGSFIVAQDSHRGQISGSVSDPSGAVLVNARVLLKNLRSGLEKVNVTNQEGEFRFASIAPGSYRLTGLQSGFSANSLDLELREGEAKIVDIHLAISPREEQLTVVSGSREEELRENSIAHIIVVTRAQVRDTGFERVSDVLAEQSGILVRPTTHVTLGIAGEQVQGIDSRQVLVLLDGQPLVGARGSKFGTINLNRQSTGRLDRVEVVKGASSALYGSDAIGGVINLISREPRFPVESSMTTSAGNLGTFDIRADAGFLWKKLSFYADIEHHKSNDYSLIPSEFSTTAPRSHRNDGLLKLKYQWTPHFSLSFTGNSYQNEDVGRGFGEQGAQTSISHDSAQNYGLTADYSLNPLTRFWLRGYFSRYDETSLTRLVQSPSSPAAPGNLNERLYKLDLTGSRIIGSRQHLQTGVEWYQDRYFGFNRIVGDSAGQQISVVDLWFQDQLAINRRLSATLGGRYDNHSTYGSYFSPKAGVLLRASDSFVLKASYGQGFRAPDLSQLYSRFLNPTNLYQVIGNPALQPETSRSVNFGAEYFKRRGRIGLTLFRNDVHNLIDTQRLGRPRTTAELAAISQQFGIPPAFNPQLNRLLFFYRNLADIYTQGAELEGSLNVWSGFEVAGSYTLLRAIDKLTGNRLAQRHPQQGNVRFTYADEKHGWRTNLRGHFFSDWLLNNAGAKGSAYRLWDFYSSKRIAHGTELFLAVDNLFNSRDSKLRLVPATFDRPDFGRAYRVGMRWDFHSTR